jgi:hypothetical protein
MKSKVISVVAVLAEFLAVLIIAGCPMAAAGGGPAVPTITLVPPTSTTSSTISLSSTAGTTIYYTLDGSMPTTSSTVYSSSSPIYVYGNVNVTVKAFAAVNGQDSGIASQTFTTSSITPFSVAASSTPYTAVSFSINGYSFVITPTITSYITFSAPNQLDPSGDSWSCLIMGALSAESGSEFYIESGGIHTVQFFNAGTLASATIYFEVTNVYTPGSV